ncbi:MAG: cupin domain-containing protein [Pseudomonadota bacterium]|nr:cupin domain-containing protein [Pseudomonadota bacterium]
MSGTTEALVVNPDERPREAFEDATRGDVSWVTFFSGDRTSTADMSCGLMEVAPNGGHLAAHRHAESELYFVAEGRGTVTIDGVRRELRPGAAVFIPGDAEHSVVNDSDAPLKVFYVFPIGNFADVVYRFSA